MTFELSRLRVLLRVPEGGQPTVCERGTSSARGTLLPSSPFSVIPTGATRPFPARGLCAPGRAAEGSLFKFPFSIFQISPSKENHHEHHDNRNHRQALAQALARHLGRPAGASRRRPNPLRRHPPRLLVAPVFVALAFTPASSLFRVGAHHPFTLSSEGLRSISAESNAAPCDFSVIPTGATRPFPARGLCVPGRGAEGPWLEPSS